MKKSTLLHLRIPFSFYLMPVFFFAVSINPNFPFWRFLVVFFSLHLFLYPASNGYNSYYDKDEGSIGGLENPPPVDKELLWSSLIFDALALVLGGLLGWEFVLALFIYGLVSKAYSHPAIRLKKMPYLGWLTVGVFQGFFTFLLVYQGIHSVGLSELQTPKVLIPAILSSAMLLGSYPMTQIYQHEEDGKRGDETISRKLGIKGTFIFTVLCFSISTAGFVWYYFNYFSLNHAIGFVVFLTPVLIFFLTWFWGVLQNTRSADFKSTMKLNQISAICLNAFYVGVWIWGVFGE